jgi:hypothetical protein
MACHVYDFLYRKVMIITICDIQSKDIETQKLMWKKLNETMLKHMLTKPNFKGFMVENKQANWNSVKIVYGSKDPFVMMVDKECIFLFHWIRLFNKHIKQLIKLDL